MIPCPGMIEIHDLTKRSGDFTAVAGLTLRAAAGEIFGFLGPNGAGKTTTIRVIAGPSPPPAGRAEVAGSAAAAAPARAPAAPAAGGAGAAAVAEPVRAKAIRGYVPGRPYLYEKLTGRELLHFVADLY